jgi:hypothetical protein
MGVLEDAIREHLELKRQHGASEEEVVRQETEVLGQARRQAAPAESDEEAIEAAEEVSNGEQDAALEELPADLAEPPEAPFDEAPAGHEPPDTEESAAVDPYATEPRSVADVFAAEPAAEPEEEPLDHDVGEEPPRDQTVILDEPVEFDELEPGSAPPMPAHEEQERPPRPVDEGDPEDEDVLEETPEFLQETPDHDRLWFEQKPPRDFDFD